MIAKIFITFLLCQGCLLFASGLGFFVSAQTTGSRNYSGEKLSFSYPANWKIVDKSAKQVQQLNLIPESGTALIMIIAYRHKISTYEEFDQLNSGISQPYIGKISQSFSSSRRATTCTKIKNSSVPGYRITGLYNNEESLSDIFAFALDGKFFNLIYMRAVKDASKTDLAWSAIRETLTAREGNSETPSTFLIDLDNNAVLNSLAIKLPKPIFPSAGVQTGPVRLRSTIPVQVRVVIDENGDVISAKAISGDPAYFPAAIMAAKKAKFQPAHICGELTKITGIILYNFIRG